MARFIIERVADGDNVPPNIPGHRLTISLPEPPPTIQTWGDLIDWFAYHPDVPHRFHLAAIALIRAFRIPKPPL